MLRMLRVLIPCGVLLAIGAGALAGPHCLPIIVEDVKKIDPKLLRPNATFHIEVPILGKSTHRTRGNPSTVMMSVHLPANYDPKRAHPVIIHLGGGVDQRKFINRWIQITGNKDCIILLAEFTSTLITGPRNAGQMLRVLDAATKIKYGAVMLAGISSGSWGMHSNFADQFYSRGYMDPFDAFIFIAGNNNNYISVTKEKLAGRPALFVGANNATSKQWQKATHDSLVEAGADSTYIDMFHHYSDFPKDCDPKIMQWIRDKVATRQKLYDDFDKKLEEAKTAEDTLALLNDELFYWHGKTVAMTRYIELAKKETDAKKREAILEKLREVTNPPRCNGGEYMDALLWLKEQDGWDYFVRQLAPQNFFIDPVDGHFNGYAEGTDFRAS